MGKTLHFIQRHIKKRNCVIPGCSYDPVGCTKRLCSERNHKRFCGDK